MACIGEVIDTGKVDRYQIVCTKTLYNYMYLELLDIKNTDLPIKLHRNTKFTRVRKQKKKLGTSITERPIGINGRNEFGHQEIDIGIGEKSKNDNVLLTILERKTRYDIVLDIVSKTNNVVMDAINLQLNQKQIQRFIFPTHIHLLIRKLIMP